MLQIYRKKPDRTPKQLALFIVDEFVRLMTSAVPRNATTQIVIIYQNT
jgi:hypothetical protein